MEESECSPYNSPVCDRGCWENAMCPICGEHSRYQGVGRCLPPNAVHGNWEGHGAAFRWCEGCKYTFKIKIPVGF